QPLFSFGPEVAKVTSRLLAGTREFVILTKAGQVKLVTESREDGILLSKLSFVSIVGGSRVLLLSETGRMYDISYYKVGTALEECVIGTSITQPIASIDLDYQGNPS